MIRGLWRIEAVEKLDNAADRVHENQLVVQMWRKIELEDWKS